MEINGKSVTADEYLEHCLSVSQGDDESTKKRNLSRNLIRKYFKRRHSLVFDRSGDTKTLRGLDNLTDDKLDKTIHKLSSYQKIRFHTLYAIVAFRL